MAWLERLLVDEDPEAVLAILQEIREEGENEDAVKAWREVDSAGLLHFSGKRVDIEKNRVVGLHSRMKLDS